MKKEKTDKQKLMQRIAKLLEPHLERELTITDPDHFIGLNPEDIYDCGTQDGQKILASQVEYLLIEEWDK